MVIVAENVTPKVLPSGHLELSSDDAGPRLRYGPTGTAMWIALNQSAGELHRAADMLAMLWGTDKATTYADMASWVDELRAAGMLLDAAPAQLAS